MAERITIKDIARELNIHHSTVSRALRNDPRVKENTRRKILNYAREHGYQVNISALQLRGNVRNIIAVLVPNIHHMYFSNIVSLIANKAKEDNYIVSIFQSNENVKEEQEIIQTVIRNNMAGVIASISLQTEESAHFDALKRFKIPLVFFDRVCEKANVSSVTVNSKDVVTKAVEMLAQKGHDRIAHITGSTHLNVFRDRQMGYLEGLKRQGLAYQKMEVINREFTPEDGRWAIQKLLSEEPKPNALIVDSHNLNIGVIQELRAQGVKIPGDIGLISFGENPSVDVIQPGITTIVQPEEEIANASYRLLKQQLENKKDIQPEHVVVNAQIFERESV